MTNKYIPQDQLVELKNNMEVEIEKICLLEKIVEKLENIELHLKYITEEDIDEDKIL